MAVIRALQARYESHRRWAKWAAPIWLYVSVTGVLVYLMLYVWFPPA
jgi:putative membrane protein